MTITKIDTLSFLPLSPETILHESKQKIRLAKLISLFSDEIRKTIVAIKTDNWNGFDPVVGDNLCQIRAYIIYLFSRKKIAIRKEANHKLKYFMNFYMKSLRLIEKNIASQNSSQRNSYISLHEFIHKNDLYFEISEELFFLFSCHFLTQFNTGLIKGIPIFIDYPKLTETLMIQSTSFANKITHHFQRYISIYSTKFIHLQCEKRRSEPYLVDMSVFFAREDEIKRNMLPSFLVTFILLKLMLKNQCPILLKLNLQLDTKTENVDLYFEPQKKFYEFINEPRADKKASYGIIFKCTANISNTSIIAHIKKIINTNIVEIILANMSTHPQYPGKKLQNLRTDPYQILLENDNHSSEYDFKAYKNLKSNSKEFNHFLLFYQNFLAMRNFSTSYGCEYLNPSFLLIQHIFLGQINKHYQHSLQRIFAMYQPSIAETTI